MEAHAHNRSVRQRVGPRRADASRPSLSMSLVFIHYVRREHRRVDR
jgi:hypothetical protein